MIQLAWRDERSYWINLNVPSYSNIHSRGILVQTCLDLTMYSKIRHRRLRKNNCLGNTLRYHLILFQNSLKCILTLIITQGNCIKLWDRYGTCWHPDTPTRIRWKVERLGDWEAGKLRGWAAERLRIWEQTVWGAGVNLMYNTYIYILW